MAEDKSVVSSHSFLTAAKFPPGHLFLQELYFFCENIGRLFQKPNEIIFNYKFLEYAHEYQIIF